MVYTQSCALGGGLLISASIPWAPVAASVAATKQKQEQAIQEVELGRPPRALVAVQTDRTGWGVSLRGEAFPNTVFLKTEEGTQR